MAFLNTFVSCNLLCWLYIFLITLSLEVEQTFSISHWNLNSIYSYNFAKLYLLKAYVSVQKFDINCLWETFLDSSVDDESLEISGYYSIRFDHPTNKKRGGTCIWVLLNPPTTDQPTTDRPTDRPTYRPTTDSPTHRRNNYV